MAETYLRTYNLDAESAAMLDEMCATEDRGASAMVRVVIKSYFADWKMHRSGIPTMHIPIARLQPEPTAE